MRPSVPLSPPVFHVLLALGDDVLHGYAIMQRFEEMTGGADRLLPGTLYVTLARMAVVFEADGLLSLDLKSPLVERACQHGLVH